MAKKATSKINNLPSTEGIAYHAAQKIFRENPGIFSTDGKIKTTIDFDLQWKITEIAKNNLYGLKNKTSPKQEF
ncbi:hypothetical protein LEP1GSC127_0701 [Leptospira kirschneri str. 200801925]|nr:hypothetical protein LEP1GSC127_0701 [Leptospira kirschneri str. 200801925]